jgi:hypothetical protein
MSWSEGSVSLEGTMVWSRGRSDRDHRATSPLHFLELIVPSFDYIYVNAFPHLSRSIAHLDNSLDHGDTLLLLQDVSEKLAGLNHQHTF